MGRSTSLTYENHSYMKTLTTILLTLMLLSATYIPSKKETINGILYSDEGIISLTMENGKITGLQQSTDPETTADVYIAPGLIDVQINGYMGVDFSGPDLTVEGVRKATKALWKAGVTSYFPTIITNDIELIKRNFAVLAKARQDPEIGLSIPGFHLEGPYISPLAGFRGAHLEKYIKAPEWDEFQQIQKAANNGIILLTMAPELEGAIPFIKKCVASGVTVSLGHHNGSAKEVQSAVAAGAKMATHLGNGCANEINRHNNPLWPQLSNDAITASIIADGFHLTREEVRTFYKAKGVENTILVSDALDLAGLPPGEYTRGERTLVLTPDVVQLPKENVLAGAASPISKCVGVVMEYTECGLKNAIQMATTNPAKLFSLNELGTIEIGKRADLIQFTMENNRMTILKTYVNGSLVYTMD
jgi:N-acetylglucosamine-6-phosphate deacetylase